jgi:hypothetical protein
MTVIKFGPDANLNTARPFVPNTLLAATKGVIE